MYVLGALIVLGFMALLGILIFVGVPDVNMELLYLAVGALIGYSGNVIQYFFGSSKGSSDKTKMLKQ
jgi:hypothetical protein